MELAEPIEQINKRLIEYFGLDLVTSQAIWRVVWSDDQYEKRLTEFTERGLQLLHPEVRLLKKYPYIKERWILERLVIVPDINKKELPTSNISYEPMWTFEDNSQSYLPPTWIACKFVVDTIYAAIGKSTLNKYVDPESSLEKSLELREKRINQLEADLFGNETNVTDALATKNAIVVPGKDN